MSAHGAKGDFGAAKTPPSSQQGASRKDVFQTIERVMAEAVRPK
jgi:hypothetical protein